MIATEVESQVLRTSTSKAKTSRYDVSEHLHTEEEMVLLHEHAE